MAKERISQRLKVYTTRIGVRDWLVAAESQKAALKAWDVHKNLFATGDARVTNEPAHVALALRTPGLPVAAPGPIPGVSNIVKLDSYRGKAPAAPKRPLPPAPPPKPDRSKLDAAEKALAEFEREVVKKRGDIERRTRAMELEAQAFDLETERKRERLSKRVKREREALGE